MSYSRLSLEDQVARRRWKLRDLLETIRDGRPWLNEHTDILLDIVLSSKYNEDKQLSKRIQSERHKQTLAREKKHREEISALKADFKKEIARVEHEATLDRKQVFGELLEQELPKLARFLTSGAAMAWERAVDPETGELDLAKLDRRELETSLKFIQAITKAAGVEGVQKVEHTHSQGSVFDALDAVEIEDAEVVTDGEG